ncbi:hypothetical protein M758_9G034600 [Ceratodon purpureus]|nr:hypothetical protein M758_9G034600 [Ceratodon purpureus]
MRNDENFLWMQLSKCRIIDKRTRKLLNVINVLGEPLEAGCPVMDTQLLAQTVPVLGRPGTPLCSAALKFRANYILVCQSWK